MEIQHTNIALLVAMELNFGVNLGILMLKFNFKKNKNKKLKIFKNKNILKELKIV
jgi:hypothetical protein